MQKKNVLQRSVGQLINTNLVIFLHFADVFDICQRLLIWNLFFYFFNFIFYHDLKFVFYFFNFIFFYQDLKFVFIFLILFFIKIWNMGFFIFYFIFYQDLKFVFLFFSFYFFYQDLKFISFLILNKYLLSYQILYFLKEGPLPPPQKNCISFRPHKNWIRPLRSAQMLEIVPKCLQP